MSENRIFVSFTPRIKLDHILGFFFELLEGELMKSDHACRCVICN
jgi:hypothetical protein